MLAFLLLSPLLAQDPGTVTLPLSQWEQMLDASQAAAERPLAPVEVLQIERSIDGSFSRGVFSGTLRTRVWVPPGREVRVPVLESSASIASVKLDGKATSLLPEGGTYTVAVAQPGEHNIEVAFFTGREDDRFARELNLQLPASGPTRVSLWVPEQDIEAEIAQGAVTGLRPDGAGTRIEGQLDGRGQLRMSWKSQKQTEAVNTRLEARVHTLFTLHEALLRGVTVVDTTVLEGETDRLALRLPDGVEVVDVEGDAVLQWRTEDGMLLVLLRYLVDERTSIRVQFQLPVDLDKPVSLRLPLPADGVPFTGSVGVQGPAGLQAQVQTVNGASDLRDLPPELAALTPNPLLLGFELSGVPEIVLNVTRQAEVELTSTRIDELEATTVLIEDGAEITRAQLHVVNQTRQYLAVRLPEGATLTQARIDGRPVRPAISPDGALLLPLLQSEKLSADAARTWVVRSGDTLDIIADQIYGDPSRWMSIYEGNLDQIFDISNLIVGQTLHIPDLGQQQITRFVVELAWTRPGQALGWLGSRSFTLPAFDAEVGAAEWHVYVPEAVYPITFGGNLSAYSHLRYDHLRRLRDFWGLAWRENDAWAGSEWDSKVAMPYDNILARRKSIYAEENTQGQVAQEALGAFPLVGERYRFKRLLLGQEVPRLDLSFVDRDLLPPLRIGALAASLALTLAWTRRAGRDRLGPALGFFGLLVLAWFVEGVHRRMLWGIDLGLLWVLGRSLWPNLPPEPLGRAQILDRWNVRNLAIGFGLYFLLFPIMMLPLLWSSVALILLVARVRRLA